MLNLDDSAAYERIDRSNLYPELIALPEQLAATWDLGSRLHLPAWNDLRQVLIAGMGGSAIGADLLAAYTEPIAKIPIVVHRDYDLPAWASGAQTLVIASSHSGRYGGDPFGFLPGCGARLPGAGNNHRRSAGGDGAIQRDPGLAIQPQRATQDGSRLEFRSAAGCGIPRRADPGPAG